MQIVEPIVQRQQHVPRPQLVEPMVQGHLEVILVVTLVNLLSNI